MPYPQLETTVSQTVIAAAGRCRRAPLAVAGSSSLVVNVCVKEKEGGKADNKVNAVKGRSDRVRLVAVRKGPVGIGRNGERFHERGKIGKHRHDGPKQQPSDRRGSVGGDDLAQQQVGKHVVRRKVKMGRQKHGHGHVVESNGVRHGVGRLQDAVKVVRVPVVANETVDGQPHIGLEGVALRERSPAVGSAASGNSSSGCRRKGRASPPHT